MKEVVIKNIMLSIRNNTDYTEQKLNEIKYGLESLYLTLTKIGVIYVISIRLTGFGIHAKSTKECWIASILVFVPFPYLLKLIVIPKYINFILSLIGTILLLIYSPADTVKRPLIHKKKRIMYKVITTLLASIYTVIVIFTKNNILSNTLTFSIILEMTMVLPINYKERRIN